MKNDRTKYSDAQVLELADQVDFCCPMCLKSLVYEKAKTLKKNFELAHIYPLNPTLFEAALLSGEARLSADPNHIDNIIPLCFDCHTKFDNPRTIEDYRLVLQKKQKAILVQSAKKLWYENPLEGEISTLLRTLSAVDPVDEGTELGLLPKAVEDKLDGTMSPISRRRIQRDVSEYFHTVRKELKQLDSAKRTQSELIALQIRQYYLRVRTKFATQQQVFEEIVKWVNVKSCGVSPEASRILVSFFVQDCEVFE